MSGSNEHFMAKSFKLPRLKSFSDSQKVACFDIMFRFMTNHWVRMANDERAKDHESYLFELCMELCFKDDCWDAYNKLPGNR